MNIVNVSIVKLLIPILVKYSSVKHYNNQFILLNLLVQSFKKIMFCNIILLIIK